MILLLFVVLVVVVLIISGSKLPGSVSNVTFNLNNDLSPLTIFWDAAPNAEDYVVGVENALNLEVTNINVTGTEATVEFTFTNALRLNVSIRGRNKYGLGPAYKFISQEACFPENSQVTMSDGSLKNIQDVEIGDLVLGAFLEVNAVLGLQRILVKHNKLIQINGRHITTTHHPHLCANTAFGVFENIISDVYGKNYIITGSKGPTVRTLDGLSSERIGSYAVGTELKTLQGTQMINTIVKVELPEEDLLYNLVVSGSHTYFVNGFAVTGWPSESDFDYLEWKPIEAEKILNINK